MKTVNISNVLIFNNFAILENYYDIIDPCDTDYLSCEICYEASLKETCLADHVNRTTEKHSTLPHKLLNPK